MAGPLQLTQTNPLLVFAHPLIDVAFEPGLFGCHLRAHGAAARAPARTASLSPAQESGFRRPLSLSAVIQLQGVSADGVVRLTYKRHMECQAWLRLTCVMVAKNIVAPKRAKHTS